MNELSQLLEKMEEEPSISLSFTRQFHITINDPVFLSPDNCDLVGNATSQTSSVYCVSNQKSAIHQVFLDGADHFQSIVTDMPGISSLRCLTPYSTPLLLFTQARKAFVLDTSASCIVATVSTKDIINSSSMGCSPFQLYFHFLCFIVAFCPLRP